MAAPEAVRVSVIVPARNEEACLGACLESLVKQTGVDFEVLVVDDTSTDRTREIALSFPGVRVVDAPPLPPGWSGKNNALATGVREARGEWLLFTDADTVHLPGSLARSLAEARQHGASLLSYSPAQEVRGFWERAVMPVVFAELAQAYRPSDISDPALPAAAANGQYLLISRDAYEAVGGHALVAADLLEDVALAKAVKQSGRKIFFRFGGDAVRTRMYRNFNQLREGWTKNLALLFPATVRLASLRSLEFCVILAGAVVAAIAAGRGAWHTATPVGLAVLALYALFLKRIRNAHFSWDANFLALFGLPVFAYLLLRSRLSYQQGVVTWKGRRYEARSARAADRHRPEDGDVNRSSEIEGRSWSI